MIDEVTRDAIDVMKQGGLEVAERAIEKWWMGTYDACGDEMKKERIQHWKSVLIAIRTICSELREKDD